MYFNCRRWMLNNTMKPLTSEQRSRLLSLLQDDESTRSVAAKMRISPSTVSKNRTKYLPDLPKSAGGRPSSLTSTDVRHATRLIATGKAENAVEVRQILGDTINKPPCVQTYRNHMKRAGWKPEASTKKRPSKSTPQGRKSH
ncbi:hypothetical protein SCHPADRAFT_686989 [Schizopora paradoxa]|uniref:Uncharacterized protein n=1 Tax=Schizopora paradoxa TaxID=27342 RepID=A0A0H2R413_9AGAM|nr:hypothetical protein SCHPADRAFT_686989 [Schizopora paradoxa]